MATRALSYMCVLEVHLSKAILNIERVHLGLILGYFEYIKGHLKKSFWYTKVHLLSPNGNFGLFKSSKGYFKSIYS